MSDNYLGTILPVAFPFAPKGWALCNGQSMDVLQNMNLFMLLGTTYGGNGVTHFNLPNLCGRFPLGAAPAYKTGHTGGRTTVSMGIEHMPHHTHAATVKFDSTSKGFLKVSKDSATTSVPGEGMLPAAPKAIDESGSGIQLNIFGYTEASLNVDYLPAVSFQNAKMSIENGYNGGNKPVDIMNPFLAISFIIAIEGRFPERS